MVGKLVKFVLFAGLVAGLGLGATVTLGSRDRPTDAVLAPSADRVVELAEVEVARVRRQDLVNEVRLSGALSPVRQTRLSAEVSGTVEAIAADVGDSVEAGDVILRFDTDTLESLLAARVATLEALQAQLRLAESTLERNRQLGEAGIASEASQLAAEADVLNFRAQVRALEAEVGDARRTLGDAAVKAPFDGVVSARSVEVGQTVAANAELFEIVDLSEMEVEAALPASRIAAVRVGQSAAFGIEGLPGLVFPATVARISPVAEPGSRAVRVFLTIRNPAGTLRGGLFATGTLRIRDFPDVIALPSAAVRRDGEGPFVLKAADGRLVRQGVGTGETFPDRDLVEISEGLSEGDVVVTAPLPDLQADTDVRIAEV